MFKKLYSENLKKLNDIRKIFEMEEIKNEEIIEENF